MQTLWRALVIPLFVVAGVVATIKAPDTVGHTVQSLGSTVFSFVTAQPQLSSAIVIGGMLLLLSSSIVPLLGAGFLFLLVFAPDKVTQFLPQLPQIPSVPSWAVPGPVKEVRNGFERCKGCAAVHTVCSAFSCMLQQKRYAQGVIMMYTCRCRGVCMIHNSLFVTSCSGHDASDATACCPCRYKHS